MKNKVKIKIIDKNKIITEQLCLDKIFEIAKNIYDDKTIFIGVGKENEKSDAFWSNKYIKELSELDNVYFTDNDFFQSLNIRSAYQSIKVVKNILEKMDNDQDIKKIFLSGKKMANSLPTSEKQTENTLDNLDYEENTISEEIEELTFNFKHAKEKNDLKDVLNQKNIYTNLDKKDNQKIRYSKEEFLKKMSHFENLNSTIYNMLIKTFETINGMKNHEGYFEVPVGVVPRPQDESGIFDNNADDYFFTIIDVTGKALYQDSVGVNKNLLISVEIYEAMGIMVLILVNGYKHISHKPVDKLCSLLDIPLYYSENKNIFYKKYVDFLYDNEVQKK